jgi:hypothetical protein
MVQVGIGQPGPEPGVEVDGRLLQPQERGFARLGQLDHLDPPVGRVPRAGDQAAGVHGIEVMRQGGFADPHGSGQLTLVGRLADLQVEQDQPDRQRAAGSL